MSKKDKSVCDMLSGGSDKRQTVGARIERRLEVLQSWLREGVPADKAIPKSLTAVRLWDDPELGIESIRSPNEFTKTHHTYGDRVREVAVLLSELRRESGSSAKAGAGRTSRALPSFDKRAFERQLEATVSQWHSEREQRLREQKRADSAEARSVLLLEENALKDQLIADLRRQIGAFKGLRVMK
ncbi:MULTISPECIES: hypothetical protein [unclassified Sulfitobacter]|uniref:hypothetical protein n=1 Tax=unclassified Sulfitobacter TaxID=196795 RepID=UPI0023E2073C|nr:MULTISPECIES: hypothetical protein [unclassified Sulfitobacter]MDF3382558.1 hypothetical protein [Sulfitobacter sp. Ks11]MDF3385977.1 hypothetical protein [Sulfitobacter sp. M85]MDF3389396.1 hypothetical protein [Sulfitobacter sp. Ks16]MDF3400033.1 hypothetical protein [Sulfitobacter sp. KE39]MDF3403454.1 hypothetical protein [Sulfitobacter sp. Ks35]